VDVTDSSGLLRDWRVVLAAGVAVLSAAVTTLVVRTGDPATADSFLGDVRDAAVVLQDGTLVIAKNGLRVPEGAVVRTGAGGGAKLTTAGRDVYLGALSTVRIIDGVHQSLDRGQVIVDSRGGARLDLATRAGSAALPGGSLVRVENGPVLRLGVFAGKASLTAAGRQATVQVPSLYQVQAPYTGVPGRATPLALTDDAWEQQLAPELVNADRDLNALARGLAGADGATVLQAAPAALREVQPINADRGEQALGVAVAQASRRSAQLKDTLEFVQTARDEGGSWGVVAALVQSRVSAVSALLDTVLAPPGPTPGTVVAEPTPGLGGQPGTSPEPSPGTSPSTGGRPTSGPPSPTRSPTPRPTGSASPAPDLITTVMNLLSPSPTPKAEATPRPTGLLHLPIGG
jgi:hypothetical protein